MWMMCHGQSDRLDESEYSADTIHLGLIHISNDFHIHFDPLTLHPDCLIDNRICCWFFFLCFFHELFHCNDIIATYGFFPQIKMCTMERKGTYAYIRMNDMLMECMHRRLETGFDLNMQLNYDGNAVVKTIHEYSSIQTDKKPIQFSLKTLDSIALSNTCQVIIWNIV